MKKKAKKSAKAPKAVKKVPMLRVAESLEGIHGILMRAEAQEAVRHADLSIEKLEKELQDVPLCRHDGEKCHYCGAGPTTVIMRGAFVIGCVSCVAAVLKPANGVEAGSSVAASAST